MRELKGRVAAITGAASGIGRATALALAREGCELALSDVSVEGLEETARAAREIGAEVTTRQLDVADREAVYAWADEVVAHFGRANLVVNNAGVALTATVDSMSYEDLEWLMGINFWGVVYGTKAFLPHLKASRDGHVVNISSVFGIIAVPTQSAYHAAKFAVRGFTECLRQELEIENAGVSATCVHPGGIRTNIVRSGRLALEGAWDNRSEQQMNDEFEKVARTSPEQAAAAILRGIRNDSRRVLIGPDARLIDIVQRLLGPAYQSITKRMSKRQLGVRKA